MCIACEMGFWDMMDALPPETRERILREQDLREQDLRQQEEAARFACDVPEEKPPADATPVAQPGADERKP